MSNEASVKQLDLIKTKYNKIGAVVESLTEAQGEIVSNLLTPVIEPLSLVAGGGSCSKRDASRIIDALFAAEKIVPVTEVRWTKGLAGDWVLTGPASVLVEGATVSVVTRKAPQGVDTKVGKVIQVDDVAGTAWAKPAELVTADLALGFYLVDGTVFHVDTTRNGQVVAYRIVPGEKKVYEGKRPLATIKPEHRLTLEQAVALGHQNHHCCVCGRTLEVKASIEAGIGPVCASKL